MARDFDLAKLLTSDGLTSKQNRNSNFGRGSGKVGVGTTDPTYKLHVSGSLGATSLYIDDTQVSSTATELNLLDGVTATTSEINYLDGVTSNIQTQIDNISSSFTIAADSGTSDSFTTGQTLTFAGGTGIDTTVSDNQISIAIDSTVATLTGSQTLTNKTLTAPVISTITNTGTLTLPTSTGTVALTSDITLSTLSITATATELNTLDGITATTTELNYVDGVTSAIQTQLDAKLASASYTASDILTKIKTVDGASSGLDADTLDGQQGSYYTSYTDTAVANLVDSAPGTLDTLNELAAALGDDANFAATTSTALGNRLRVDTAAQSLTGTQQTNALTNLGITATTTELNYTDGVTSNIQTQLDGKQASGSYLTGNQTITLSGDVSGSGTTSITVTVADDSHNHIISNVDGLQTALDAKLASSSYTAADVLTKIKTVDGAGSGLDADLLDGISSASFLRSDVSDTATGTHTFDDLRADGGNLILGDDAFSSSTDYVGMKTSYMSGSNDYMIISGLSDGNTYVSAKDGSSVKIRGGGNNGTNELEVYDGGSPTIGGNVIWHAGNDGAGSGLDADTLDGISSASFLRSDQSDTIDAGVNTTLTILSDDTGASTIEIYGNSQGTGRVYVGQSSTYGGGIEYNGDNSPSTTGAGADYITLWRKEAGTDYWTARNRYNSNDWEFRADVSAVNFNGVASSAKYADLAESYEADAEYALGTVLIFGGEKEVTQSTTKMDRRKAGVVSEKPAFKMNMDLPDQVDHAPYVALQGRVPCRVVGEVHKGDLMISSSVPGCAEAWREEGDPRYGSVIGKSLVNKTSNKEELIEVAVGVI